MTRLSAVLCLCLGISSVAFGQWDRQIRLTNDRYEYGYLRIIVDDSLHLQAFYTRSLDTLAGQPNSLFYQRFNNWGNPLCQPINVLPDSHSYRFDQDYEPGVFLDRNQVIHVVWTRYWDRGPNHYGMFYARMDLNGNFLTLPTALDLNGIGTTQSGVNMVQTANGDIWMSDGYTFMKFSEDGQALTVRERILEPRPWVEGARFQVDSHNHVWALARYFYSTFPQQIALIRIDTTDRQPEFLWENQGTQEIQMTPQGFLIDPAGNFHYIIYREDWGSCTDTTREMGRERTAR